MALTNIEVVSVPVTDQDTAKSFYVDKLGFSVEIDNAFAGGSMRWVMLRPPGSGTAITLVTWFETMTAGSLRGAALGCVSLEKRRADLAVRGVTYNEEDIQEARWGRWRTLADPDGNAWVLQQNN